MVCNLVESMKKKAVNYLSQRHVFVCACVTFALLVALAVLSETTVMGQKAFHRDYDGNPRTQHTLRDMKNNSWKDVWEKKSRLNTIVLDCMVKADGFDSVFGSLSVEDWRQYVQELFNLIGIKHTDSVFDVGCGSGAFLYDHFLSGGGSVGGVDYSSQLIDLARGFMHPSDFSVGEASAISEVQKYDVVISHSVFQYFDDFNMAETVLNKMKEKAIRTFAVLDVNDEEYREIYYEERIRKFKEEGLSETDYWNKYRDLNQLFFSKEFFKDFGKKHHCEVLISPQDNANYGNSKYRFNVVFQK